MAPTQLKITPTQLSGDKLTIAKVEGWFKKFKSIAEFYEWGNDTAKYLPLFFEDSDRAAIEIVKSSLIRSLLTKDPFEAFHSRVLQEDEPLLDFSYDLKHLATRLLSESGDSAPVSSSIVDGLARSQFLRGIPPAVAGKLRVLQLDSLDEVVKRAQLVLNEDNADTDTAFYVNSSRRFYGGKGKGNRNHGKGYGKGAYAKGKGRKGAVRDPYWFNRCYTCGQQGHLARDCPQAVGMDQNSGLLAIGDPLTTSGVDANEQENENGGMH
ncbi:hypothetical protein FOZ63_032995 [Perkinsus olseni]|uniref:CCHC-type domain-containing protein n=1 Tax=Perkinsus olseni TaxID=32597 RepID=A0A7J6SQI2_PEROL|nr:hypothetical protein FOZ63_032995 [Perkinsus olseni]